MKRHFGVVVAVWLLLMSVYASQTIASKMALPPTGDQYAHTVSFQVLQFTYFKFPALVVLLACALLTTAAVVAVSKSTFGRSGKRLLRKTLWAGVGTSLVAALWHNATAETEYNPYFQYDEQLALEFTTTWLPLIAGAVAAVVALELRWLSRPAS